jgi:hypothetical protein
VQAQVAQQRLGRELLADQLGRRQREQDLPAMPGRQQPCDAVEGWAEVIAVALLGHATV